MVTLKDIAQLISDPSKVGKEHLETLSELARQHPYSQIYSILYLKGLMNISDIRFEDELLRHSFRITDRVQLYKLIHDYQPSEDTSTQGEQKEEAVETEQIQLINEPEVTIPEITTVEEERTEVPEEKSVESETEEVVVETEAIENSNDETETVAEEIESTEETEKAADQLEENILHHVLTNAYQLDELTVEEEAELELKKQEKQEQQTEKIAVQEENYPVDEGKHSFTSWLKANNNYENLPDEDRKHIKEVVTNFENFDPSEDLFGEIEKPKTEFFSPTKKAKESLDETSIPVSETLAKIYALQGNYPKAIDAYEQLILINPEKKIFFANQIKELKKKIHEK